MPETINHFPVLDQGLARQAAESEIPFRELSLQAKSLGNMALAGQLVGTANEISSLYLNSHQEVSSVISTINTEVSSNTEELSEKKIYNAEAIDEILKSTFFANKYYVDKAGEDTTVVANGVEAVSMGRTTRNAHQPNRGAELLGRMIGGRRRYEDIEDKAFGQAGISEIVTLTEPAAEVSALEEKYDDQYSTTLGALKRMSGATLHDETLKVLQYKIVCGIDRFEYTDPRGRNGTQSEFIIVLPASQADSVYSAMKSDPNLARTINDAMMLKVLDGKLYKGGMSSVGDSEVDPNNPQALWDSRRPPYSEWKKNNEGIARMAFRDHIKAGPAESTVVEF